jgi:hypothetical protein
MQNQTHFIDSLESGHPHNQPIRSGRKTWEAEDAAVVGFRSRHYVRIDINGLNLDSGYDLALWVRDLSIDCRVRTLREQIRCVPANENQETEHKPPSAGH